MSVEYQFKPSGFFVFRTALLPFQTFEDWGRDLKATGAEGRDEAVMTDETELRRRLQALLLDPVLKEALFLASPDLAGGLSYWYEDPHSTKGRRVERTVVKYFSRLCGRSTPFGLFAGCSLGRLSTRTRIVTGPMETYIRHTRPDMDYLCSLASALTSDPTIARRLTYTPNTSLYVATGRLHYCESRQKGKQRSYHLVAVDRTDYLEELLTRARKGASFKDLAASLIDGEVSQDEAEDFIHELIQSQILVPNLDPTVTGPEPLHTMIATLATLSHEGATVAAEALTHLRDELATIDASPLGLSKERYEALAGCLRALPVPVEMNRLFQTDLIKPAPEAELGGEVLVELQSALDTLWRLQNHRPGDPFKDFVQAFQERYGSMEVPLAKVLDEESGVGFGTKGGGGPEDTPLLAGLPFKSRSGEAQVYWGKWEDWLYQRLMEDQTSGNTVLTLTRRDLEPFLNRKQEILPDAFSVMIKVAAESQAAVEEGRFHIYLVGGAGPSGANLLGRFCHGNQELADQVHQFLRQEEAFHPDKIFAEIVHLPEGRTGNVILRPALRSFEIPFLGRGGLDAEHQIPLSDLLVSVRGGRVILRSYRLGKEVVPRLTSAHNYQTRGLGVYRFLCMLQHQQPSGSVSWNWGPMGNLSFLPRVELGRTVLSKAQWLVKGEELKTSLTAKPGDRMKIIHEWMAKRKVPRLLLLSDGDNKLPVDLHNTLSVDVFLDLVKERPSFIIEEFYPDPRELGSFAPEGSFVHELVVPFLAVREAHTAPASLDSPAPARVWPAIVRSHSPGSEWLYLKIYTGYAGADTLLRGPISLLVDEAMASGAGDEWHFIRFTDPDHHIRLRIHGDPSRLCAEVLPRAHELLKPHTMSGLVSKIMLDTYEREVERYGGDAGIPMCEAIFHADSVFALSVLQRFHGDAFADQRWRLTLASSERLLHDFGYNLLDRVRLVSAIRDSFRREFAVEGKAEYPYGKRFREERMAIESLLWHPYASSLKEVIPLLDVRSQNIAGPVSMLRALCEEVSGPSLDSLLQSLIHMTSNRILRSAQRLQELAISDFMVRAFESKLARTSGAKSDTLKSSPFLNQR